jgi:hypothetical protein
MCSIVEKRFRESHDMSIEKAQAAEQRSKKKEKK